MPFPLAHPAAVLPFRRFCPRFLSFPALIAGSVSPDAGYLFKEEGISDFSHSLLGGTIFGTIVGFLMVLLLYSLRRLPIRRLLPAQSQKSKVLTDELQDAFMPAYSTSAVLLSLLIGVWTHLFFDSFTHTDGWMVLHSAFLRSQIGTIDHHVVRICHLLWYICSFLGIACLVVAFRNWQQRKQTGAARSLRFRVSEALIVPAVILPVEIIHHFVRSRLGLLLVIVLSLMLMIAIMVAMTRSLQMPEESA